MNFLRFSFVLNFSRVDIVMVKLENFQKACHESAVWDKMGGYKSDCWQDFHLANTTIEFCDDVGDCITHDDAENYRRQQLRCDPKTGFQEMEQV